MIRENVIFKTSFVLSAAIHIAGFGLFMGQNTPVLKNGVSADESSVIVYEIGFKEIAPVNSAMDIIQPIDTVVEESTKKQENLPSNNSVRGSSGFSEEEKGRMKEEYLLKVRERIELYKYFPKEAGRKCLKGSVKLEFYIDKNGVAHDVSIAESSRYSIFDIVAKDIILKASPFPKPPRKDLGEIKTTIVFEL